MTDFADQNTQPSVGAGGLNWLLVWRQMVADEHAQTEAVALAENTSDHDHWAGQVVRYTTATNRSPQPDAFLQLVLPHIRPTDTVLDIGAGAGRHTLFLAQHVARVIAVEPSPSMHDQLVRRLDERAIANVTVLSAAWPDVDTEVSDVAICSHVIYGVREIGPFLRAMDARTRRGCFVAAGFRQPSYVMHAFWKRIHGQTRLPLPGAIECLNALHQLGIAANLTLLPASPYRCADEAEAIADIRWRLRLSQSSETDAAIRAAMVDLLESNEAGQLAPKDQPAHTAALWWTHSA